MTEKASVVGALVVLFGIIQFLPIDKTNPPTEQEIEAPKEVVQVFKRACYNCHSYKTSWPWYSSVAPLSWLVAHDVRDGREKINFTAWQAVGPKKEAELVEQIWLTVETGIMPPWFYRFVHPESKITEREKASIGRWISERRGKS